MMSIATITNQGEASIPPEIRERLNLHPGDCAKRTSKADRIRFIIAPDGRVYIQPLHLRVEELSGILYQPNRKPVSIEEMNQAIEQNGGSLL